MSDDREPVFRRIRGALATRGERERAPEYADGAAVAERALVGRDFESAFVSRWERVRGIAFVSAADLAAWLRARNAFRGHCDALLQPQLAGAFREPFQLDAEFSRERIDDYDFSITRAIGAIAETGTVILDDASTSRRLAAIAPWIHVAVVRRSEIHRDVASALRALGDDPSVVWVTGPSKTADVEGILIEGVHGPGEQVALLGD